MRWSTEFIKPKIILPALVILGTLGGVVITIDSQKTPDTKLLPSPIPTARLETKNSRLSPTPTPTPFIRFFTGEKVPDDQYHVQETVYFAGFLAFIVWGVKKTLGPGQSQ